jgi:CHAD domain-containing protein
VDVVVRSRVVDRFVELEAELVKGDESSLARLAEVFAADPALAPERGSKLEAALVAVRNVKGRPGQPVVTAPTADNHASGEAAVTAASPTDLIPADPPQHVEIVPTTSDVLVEDVAGREASADSPVPPARSPGVTSDDHVAEAARKVMRFHLARMLAREAGVRSGHDLEDVHAMRVATRRQRAAWRVFGEAFRGNRTRRYRNGLRDVASRLGAVRDLDVLIEAADHYGTDLPIAEQRAIEPLLADWRAHRDDARVLLVRELDSDGYRRWVDDYRDFVRTEGAGVAPVGPVQPHRIRDTTASRVWSAYEQVRGYEAVLRWADVETLHELRIAGKWLRYTLEFVREALGDDSAPLIARVTALQDHLGLMNDANVAASMARTFLVEHAGDLSALENAAIGRYLVNRERDVARLRRSVGPAWRGVAGAGFGRTLGRVVARL